MQITGLATGSLEQRDRHAKVIERLGTKRISSALRRRMPDLGADDERVLVLDRLELDLDGIAETDADWIANRLAEGVVAAIARLTSGASMGRSCWFATPEARRAALLVALARGDGVNRWWFADGPDLMRLPLSSAIAVTLRRTPECILAVLAAIPRGDRALVLRQLSRIDARTVLEAVSRANAPTGGEDAWTSAFASPPPPSFSDPAKATLFGLAELRDELGFDPGGPGLAAVRTRLAVLSAFGGAEGPASAVSSALVAGLAKRDVARLEILLHGLARAEIGALASLSDGALANIATEIAAETSESSGPETSAFTRFGGLLMLWPHWPDDWAADLPGGPGDPANIAAFLGLAALAGRTGSDAAIGDTVLRAAFGIDPRANEDDLADWLGQVRPTAIDPDRPARKNDAALPPVFRSHRRNHRAIVTAGLRAVDGFARSLTGFDRASLPFLRNNLLSAGAQVTIGAGQVRTVLERPKLDVLLAISGQGDRIFVLPDGRTVELERRR